jgi:hypothetical protein
MACSLRARRARDDHRLDTKAQNRGNNQANNKGTGMIREFRYKGETFRVNAHGAPGHEEVFIIHLVEDEEMGEISIDRMTEENDTNAPIDAICVMLCDKLIIEMDIQCADLGAGFRWVDGERIRDVLPSTKSAHG